MFVTTEDIYQMLLTINMMVSLVYKIFLDIKITALADMYPLYWTNQ